MTSNTGKFERGTQEASGRFFYLTAAFLCAILHVGVKGRVVIPNIWRGDACGLIVKNDEIGYWGGIKVL